MANLVIKGHPTRGKEIIEILKILGGNTFVVLSGYLEFYGYFINSTGSIDLKHRNNFDNDIVYSLEEFLEKFPYKIGDKVQHKGATSCGSIFEVEKMRWEEDTVKYTLRLWGCNYKSFTLPAEYLQPYKEETMEEKTVNHVYSKCKTIGQGTYAIKIMDGYKFDSIDENGNIIVKSIKPQYPKTYIECAKILKCFGSAHIDGYKCELLEKLQELLICRDAYWKIAGGWRPDYINPTKESMYFIFCNGTNIEKGQGLYPTNKVLIFPTEEMRDAFKENFNDDIELCKEFL